MEKQRRVIALGFFDGVHLGHGALLRRVVSRAEELGAVPSALTFDQHPETVIFGRPTPLLSTPADRSELMRRLYGIRDVLVAHYDRAMMETPWEAFIDGFLLREHGAVHLVAGHDFRFGYRGEGDPERLKGRCRELGLGCDIIGPVTHEGITVSSTYIRALIARGEMERAAAFLGHPHTLTGTVAHGRRLGSALGFPTVNLGLPDGLLVPALGVYAARVWAGGRAYDAVTNIGIRPTVDGGGPVTVESFLLDFDGDLYGRELRVELCRFLRPERKFDSLEALRRAVTDNAQQSRAYFDALERP